MNKSEVQEQLTNILFNLKSFLTKERTLELAMYAGFCVVIFGICLGTFFLEKQATPRLVNYIESQPGLAVKITTPELTFFPLQFTAKQIALQKSPLPQIRPFTLKDVTVSVAWTDLLLFKPGLQIHADSLSASSSPMTVHILMRSLFDLNIGTVSAQFYDLHMEKLVKRIPLAGVPKGMFSGDIEFGGIGKPLDEMSGYTKLSFRNVQCNNIIPAIKGKKLNITLGQFNTSWKDGRMEIEDITIDGKQLSTSLSGDARLNSPVSESVVDIRGVLQADPKSLYTHLLDSKAIQALKKDKRVKIRISDKVSKPSIKQL